MEENYTIDICESEIEIIELENFYKQFNEEESRNLILNFSDSNRRFYKVSLNNSIVGIGCVVNDKFRFEDFKRFIHPEHRHNLFGDKLLDFIIADAKILNKASVTGYYHGNDEKVFEYFKGKGFKIYRFDIAMCLFLKLERDYKKSCFQKIDNN